MVVITLMPSSAFCVLAWQFTVATVLSKKLADGYITANDVDLIAHKLMNSNVKTAYRL